MIFSRTSEIFSETRDDLRCFAASPTPTDHLDYEAIARAMAYEQALLVEVGRIITDDAVFDDFDRDYEIVYRCLPKVAALMRAWMQRNPLHVTQAAAALCEAIHEQIEECIGAGIAERAHLSVYETIDDGARE